MKAAFHLSIAPPADPSLDAAVQEATLLQSRLGGTLDYLGGRGPVGRWRALHAPRRAIRERFRRRDGEADLHYVVTDRLRLPTYVRQADRPVVVRLLTPPRREDLAGVHSRPPATLVVSDPAAGESLRALGLPVREVRPPLIEAERWQAVPPPPGDGPLTLLMASAPWTKRQFRTKGIDLLLRAVERDDHLRLVLLWRGVHERAIRRRIAASPARARLELVVERIDVARVMARCHAVVLLATSPRVVKAFPHSLVEALGAGRPVVTTDRLAIGPWVAQRGCGLALEEGLEGLDEALAAALARLRTRYEAYRKAALEIDLTAFSEERYVTLHRELFSQLARPST